MRSRASLSASSVAASQAFTAASISAAVTRRPDASSVSRSNFAVASSRAASPRLATSSTMARAAASTSAEASRFAARKATNRWSKSALLRSRRTGILASNWFLGARFGSPGPCSMARRESCVNPWLNPWLNPWKAAFRRGPQRIWLVYRPPHPSPSTSSPVPSSSAPRSVSSHSRHSTSRRMAPPWANRSNALPPGASWP
ncbi:hypothetical protein ACVWW5_000798 [Bradyrhizobium sp. LM3.4]